jgi:hypothetical protein
MSSDNLEMNNNPLLQNNVGASADVTVNTKVSFGEPTAIFIKLKSGAKLITKDNMIAILTNLENDSKIKKLKPNDQFKEGKQYYVQKTNEPTKLYKVECKNSQMPNSLCFDDSDLRKESLLTNNIFTTEDVNQNPITVWEVQNIIGGRKSRKHRNQRKSRKQRKSRR